MTDRIKGLVVTLEQDIRDDDIKQLTNAINLIKGVVCVSNVIDNIDDQINRVRVKHQLKTQLYEVLK